MAAYDLLTSIDAAYTTAIDLGLLLPHHAAMLESGLHNNLVIQWDRWPDHANTMPAHDLVHRALRDDGGTESMESHPVISGDIPRALYEYLVIAQTAPDAWATQTYRSYRGLTQTATLDLYCFFLAHPEYWPAYRSISDGLINDDNASALSYEFHPAHVADYVTWYHDLDGWYLPTDHTFSVTVRNPAYHALAPLHLIGSLYNDLTGYYAEYHRTIYDRVMSPNFQPTGYAMPTPSWGTFAITADLLYTILCAGISCDIYFALFSPDDPTIHVLYSNNLELKLYTILYADLPRIHSAEPQFFDMDCVSQNCFPDEFTQFINSIMPCFTAEHYALIFT